MKKMAIYSNGRRQIIPLEDYLEIQAMQCGFDSYKALKAEGLSIDVNPESIIEDNLKE